MTKARDLANAGTALTSVSATELGYLDGVTSAVQTQLDAKIAKTLTTTTGDIIYASSANTPARLGIGSTDQVLKVTGGVPVWATPSSGGMTLLSTTTLSGASTTVSSIDQSYINLHIVITGVTHGANHPVFQIAPNGSTNTSMFSMVRHIAGTGASVVGSTDAYISTYSALQYNNANNALSLTIFNYADTTYRKSFNWNGYFTNSDPVQFAFTSGGGINTASAISSLVFSPSASTFSSGQVKIYGVK